MPKLVECSCCKGTGECSALDDDNDGKPVVVTGRCRACSGTGKTNRLLTGLPELDKRLAEGVTPEVMSKFRV